MNAELQAAAARAQFNRNAAFAPVNERICGIEVLPLTVWHVTALEATGSPFVCGMETPPTPEQIKTFFWLLNPRYSPRSWYRRNRLEVKVQNLGYLEAVQAIAGYIKEAFSDTPGNKQGDYGSPVQYYSWTASVINALASAYGWSEESILRLPVKRAFQYINCLAEVAGRPLFESREELEIKQAWLDGKRN